jgi:hypothetical protein
MEKLEPSAIADLWSSIVQDRKYLKAVSPKTLIWYQCSFKAFDGATSSRSDQSCGGMLEASGLARRRIRSPYFFISRKLPWRIMPGLSPVLKFTSSKLKAGPGISSKVPVAPVALVIANL